jgi:ferredoxin
MRPDQFILRDARRRAPRDEAQWLRQSRDLPAGGSCLRRYNHRENSNARAIRAMGGALLMSGKLKIHVDQDKCQGHARCKSLAPELFELDEYGNAHEIGDGSVPAGLEDKAWLAQANCPEMAIDVIEE